MLVYFYECKLVGDVVNPKFHLCPFDSILCAHRNDFGGPCEQFGSTRVVPASTIERSREAHERPDERYNQRAHLSDGRRRVRSGNGNTRKALVERYRSF